MAFCLGLIVVDFGGNAISPYFEMTYLNVANMIYVNGKVNLIIIEPPPPASGSF